MIRHRPRHLPALLVTGLLHVAIIYAFMQRQHAADAPRTPRAAMQWLLPMARPATTSPSRPQARPAPRAGITPAPTPATSPPANDSPPPPAAASTSTPAPAPAPADVADDPFAQAPAVRHPPSAGDILSQARLDVGKIDRELRAAYPQRAPVPPPDSKQARLERGINAAHDAVPPKWYQGAKIIELTTPDGENKVRVYKIVTGLGIYCIYIRPDGGKSYGLCPN